METLSLVMNQTKHVASKRVEFLREVVLDLGRLAILANTENVSAVSEMREAQAAASRLGLEIVMPEIRRAEDIAHAAQTQVAALRQELRKLGWEEGRNIRVDVRFPGADTDKVRAVLTELMSLTPDVLVTNTNLVTTVAEGGRARPD